MGKCLIPLNIDHLIRTNSTISSLRRFPLPPSLRLGFHSWLSCSIITSDLLTLSPQHNEGGFIWFSQVNHSFVFKIPSVATRFSWAGLLLPVWSRCETLDSVLLERTRATWLQLQAGLASFFKLQLNKLFYKKILSNVVKLSHQIFNIV